MNESNDRMLADWLREGPESGPREGLERTLAATRRVGQRPGWTLPERWMPMQLTMARTRAIDLIRRSRVRPQPGADDIVVQTKDDSPAQDVQLEWGQRAEAIQEAMGSLPLLQRLAIELAFFEGLTQAEIAEQLEVPLGTVKTRIRQGLLKLRDRLAGAGATL